MFARNLQSEGLEQAITSRFKTKPDLDPGGRIELNWTGINIKSRKPDHTLLQSSAFKINFSYHIIIIITCILSLSFICYLTAFVIAYPCVQSSYFTFRKRPVLSSWTCIKRQLCRLYTLLCQLCTLFTRSAVNIVHTTRSAVYIINRSVVNICSVAQLCTLFTR